MSGDGAGEVLRLRLRRHLHGQPSPVLVGSDWAIPPASLWTGMRLWTDHLRGSGPGPLVVIGRSLPVPVQVMAAGAAWWCGAAAAWHEGNLIIGASWAAAADGLCPRAADLAPVLPSLRARQWTANAIAELCAGTASADEPLLDRILLPLLRGAVVDELDCW